MLNLSYRCMKPKQAREDSKFPDSIILRVALGDRHNIVQSCTSPAAPILQAIPSITDLVLSYQLVVSVVQIVTLRHR